MDEKPYKLILIGPANTLTLLADLTEAQATAVKKASETPVVVSPPPVVDNKPTQPATPTALTVGLKSYSSATRRIEFTVSGGDGSPVEIMAPGATGWTKDLFAMVDKGLADESLRKDNTLPVKARQGGKETGWFNLPLKDTAPVVSGDTKTDSTKPPITGVDNNPVTDTPVVVTDTSDQAGEDNNGVKN